MVCAADRLSDADGAVLHLDHDRLLRLDPRRNSTKPPIIDGASWFPDADAIFIPVAMPGIIAATIFAFTVSGRSSSIRWCSRPRPIQLVLPVGIITTLIKGDVFNWGQIMTGALLGARRRSSSTLPDGLLHCRPDRRCDKGLISWLT
jgi:hypothetical protein